MMARVRYIYQSVLLMVRRFTDQIHWKVCNSQFYNKAIPILNL